MILVTDLRLIAELHDEKHQPDIKNGSQIGMPLFDLPKGDILTESLLGMPLAQFTDEAYAELAAGKEQIPVGTSKMAFEGFEADRQKAFQALVKQIDRGS